MQRIYKIFSGRVRRFYVDVCCSSRAQTDYYNADTSRPPPRRDDDAAGMPEAATVEKSHTVVVTSIEAARGGAESPVPLRARLSRILTKPYEECQRRLALKIKSQQQLKAGQTERFIRLRKSAKAPPDDAAAACASSSSRRCRKEGNYYHASRKTRTAASGGMRKPAVNGEPSQNPPNAQ